MPESNYVPSKDRRQYMPFKSLYEIMTVPLSRPLPIDESEKTLCSFLTFLVI